MFAGLVSNRAFMKAAGAVVGCHVNSMPPSGSDGQCYRERKLFPSVILQAICDHNWYVRGMALVTARLLTATLQAGWINKWITDRIRVFQGYWFFPSFFFKPSYHLRSHQHVPSASDSRHRCPGGWAWRGCSGRCGVAWFGGSECCSLISWLLSPDHDYF